MSWPRKALSQMEYAIRHMVVFNSKAYANILTTYHGSTPHRLLAVCRPGKYTKCKNEQQLRSKT